MYKKTIKFTDYNGVEHTTDAYFNLNKAELIEMNMNEEGGLEATIRKISLTTDTKELMRLFKQIILGSYGEKSADGMRFVKKPELTEAFEQSCAYPELLVELINDSDEAARFINNVVPKDVQNKVDNN